MPSPISSILVFYTVLVLVMSIFIGEIPIPDDEEELAAYLALGWYRLDGILGPRLKWPMGRGTPQHPGGKLRAGRQGVIWQHTTSAATASPA